MTAIKVILAENPCVKSGVSLLRFFVLVVNIMKADAALSQFVRAL